MMETALKILRPTDRKVKWFGVLLISTVPSFFLWKLFRHHDIRYDFFLFSDVSIYLRHYADHLARFYQLVLFTYIINEFSKPYKWLHVISRGIFLLFVFKAVLYWFFYFDISNTLYSIGIILYLVFVLFEWRNE